MTDTNAAAATHSVDELLPGSTGIWRVFTRGSTHVLNLNAGTVHRFPGPTSLGSINDVERPLRTLEMCRVGESGRWTMFTDVRSDTIDFYWHITSTIRRIEMVVPDDVDDDSDGT